MFFLIENVFLSKDKKIAYIINVIKTLSNLNYTAGAFFETQTERYKQFCCKQAFMSNL